jgi:diguanylate cyclase (GGDEF)-like protein
MTATARVTGLTAVLAAVTVPVQAAWLAGTPPLTARHLVVAVVLAVLFALIERFVVMVPVRRGAHHLSLSEIPLVVGLVLIPLPLLAAARLAGAAVGLTVFRRQRGGKLAFNLALYLTQVTVAGVMLWLVAGGADPLDPIGWAGTFVGTFVADLISLVAISAVIAIHDDRQEWRRLLTTDVRELLQLPFVLVTTALGLVTAVVVRERWPALVLLAVLGVIVYRVLARYAQQTQGHAQVEALYRFTRSLSGSADAEDVARVVLGEVRDLVRAESAKLILCHGPSVVRMRLAGPDLFTTTTGEPTEDEWWLPARDGQAVLLPNLGMAVPVALDDAVAVLAVPDHLPELPAFTAEHLRLLQAVAGHAGVALTNARLLDRLRHIGSHDGLTDLPNRRGLLAGLRTALADRPETGVVGVLMLDLDRFQEINDALGHAVGDSVLREVGVRLSDRFGDRATVARLGGDEFALVVPGAASTIEVLDLARDLHRAVAEPIEVGELTLTTPASIGVCLAPEHGVDPDALLRRADVAMYAAKNGRDGVRVYHAEDDRNTPRRLALLADLRVAVEQRQLEVYYQPQVDPATGRVLGAEALCRWFRADGPVSPDEFIPLAERSGLDRPLTRLVLDAALAACASWRRDGHDMSVSVNLSPQVVADHDLTDDVQQALQRHGLPAGALTLEITENGIMADRTHSLAALDALRALGVNLSVDDFGTGHSSLGRLANLPIQEVKIDKGFVRDVTVLAGRRAVTDATLHLGRALNLLVVAEGVETREEFDYLRDGGCGLIQGYYISRPLPEADFAAWLADRPSFLLST